MLVGGCKTLNVKGLCNFFCRFSTMAMDEILKTVFDFSFSDKSGYARAAVELQMQLRCRNVFVSSCCRTSLPASALSEAEFDVCSTHFVKNFCSSGTFPQFVAGF
jgi:hypothetical protein